MSVWKTLTDLCRKYQTKVDDRLNFFEDEDMEYSLRMFKHMWKFYMINMSSLDEEGTPFVRRMKREKRMEKKLEREKKLISEQKNKDSNTQFEKKKPMDCMFYEYFGVYKKDMDFEFNLNSQLDVTALLSKVGSFVSKAKETSHRGVNPDLSLNITLSTALSRISLTPRHLELYPQFLDTLNFYKKKEVNTSLPNDWDSWPLKTNVTTSPRVSSDKKENASNLAEKKVSHRFKTNATSTCMSTEKLVNLKSLSEDFNVLSGNVTTMSTRESADNQESVSSLLDKLDGWRFETNINSTCVTDYEKIEVNKMRNYVRKAGSSPLEDFDYKSAKVDLQYEQQTAKLLKCLESYNSMFDLETNNKNFENYEELDIEKDVDIPLNYKEIEETHNELQFRKVYLNTELNHQHTSELYDVINEQEISVKYTETDSSCKLYVLKNEQGHFLTVDEEEYFRHKKQIIIQTSCSLYPAYNRGIFLCDLYPCFPTTNSQTSVEQEINRTAFLNEEANAQTSSSDESIVSLLEDDYISNRVAAKFERKDGKGIDFYIKKGDDGLYHCKEEGCSKIFKNTYGLKYHLIKGHIGGRVLEPRPWSCYISECTKSYTSKNGLKWHIVNTHHLNWNPSFKGPEL